jgi:hypothetical protein
MTCPHLRYRSNDGEHDFDHERPYCTVVERFVSPMRADVCNDRYDFSHRTHCDVYQAVAERTVDAASRSLD